MAAVTKIIVVDWHRLQVNTAGTPQGGDTAGKWRRLTWTGDT